MFQAPSSRETVSVATNSASSQVDADYNNYSQNNVSSNSDIGIILNASSNNLLSGNRVCGKHEL